MLIMIAADDKFKKVLEISINMNKKLNKRLVKL